MAIRLTGTEFNAFLNDSSVWREDDWIEDEAISIDGGEPGELPGEVAASSVVIIHGGSIRRSEGEDDDILAIIRKWRKRQTTAFLIVQVDKGKEEAVRAAIKAAGGKVVA